MGEEQIYNPVSGIDRMLNDIKSAINPVLFKLHPTMRLLSSVNIYLVSAVFLLLLFYLTAVKKHRVINKLKNPRNYILMGVLLFVYAVLNSRPFRIGTNYELNFSIIAAPIAAKLMGPIVAGIFGIFQYITAFLLHQGETFSASTMILAGISGLIYAMIIYDRRTKYLRCLWAKLTVNIVCNILLVPMVTTDTMTSMLADSITTRMLSNIFLAPFQALIIWLALLGVRKLRKLLS